MRLLCPWNFPGKNIGVGCRPPGDFPDRGTKPISLVSSELAGRFFTNCATWEALLEKGVLNSNYVVREILFIYISAWFFSGKRLLGLCFKGQVCEFTRGRKAGSVFE